MTYSKILSMIAAVAVTAGGLIAVTPPASAKDRPVVVVAPLDLPTRRVSYIDLNLATPAGEKLLNRRVASAVRSVCNEANGISMDFYTTIACRDVAWDEARPQMKRAMQQAHEFAANGSTLTAVQAIVLVASK
jgi:UrcA family protein